MCRRPRELCAAAQDDCAHGPRMPQPSPFARTLVDRAFVMRTTDERAFEVLRRSAPPPTPPPTSRLLARPPALPPSYWWFHARARTAAVTVGFVWCGEKKKKKKTQTNDVDLPETTKSDVDTPPEKSSTFS